MVVLSDVLEHLADPGAALDRVRQVVDPGGLLYVTVPDAGSGVARLLGRRWWSVLPMHTQYFTRASIELLLRRTGFVPVWFRTHPKAFSVRYYAERIEGYAPAVARAAVRAADRFGVADRLVAPDLRDRMAVLAVADGR
jgi:SAM-dependent methyltransferase